MEIILTNHGIERVKERCGINKKAVKRIATKAYEKGMDCKNVNGIVKSWVMGRIVNHPENDKIKLYGDKAWVFTDTQDKENVVLVTVLQIPQSLQSKVNVQYA